MFSGQGRVLRYKPILVASDFDWVVLSQKEEKSRSQSHRPATGGGGNVCQRREEAGGETVTKRTAEQSWSHSSVVEPRHPAQGLWTPDRAVESNSRNNSLLQGVVSFPFNSHQWDSSGLHSSVSSTAFESPLSTADLTAALCEIFHLLAELRGSIVWYSQKKEKNCD